MHPQQIWDHRGFSLIELVIVVVIIGLIAAIAIPRFSRASQGSTEAALRADLKLLRDAIELYSAEHDGDPPSLRDTGDGAGAQTSEAFTRQLTWYTDEAGKVVRTPDAGHALGPYLRQIPPLPVGKNVGQSKVLSMNTHSTPGLAGPGYGWEYEHYFGNIRANCTVDEVGSDGVPYCEW